VQIVPEEDEHKFGFDLLDPTKLIPEELVPVKIVGRMTLNRNPDNFFAETEQVAFHPGHVVPGIDFTNDPLLQGRLFSYTDTQLIRLGGPISTKYQLTDLFHRFTTTSAMDSCARLLTGVKQVTVRIQQVEDTLFRQKLRKVDLFPIMRKLMHIKSGHAAKVSLIISVSLPCSTTASRS
jgi:hypothetical protein